MKKEVKNWFWTFLAGFLATVLGIALTFGIQNRLNEKRRAETARLLAVQIVDNMDYTFQELGDYKEAYAAIDSTAGILHWAMMADTLDRVNDTTVLRFLSGAITEYVQVDVANGIDAYKVEILNSIGDVELIDHIDKFYAHAREYTGISKQVVDQKRALSDAVYTHFYGDPTASYEDYVRYIFDMPEFRLFFARLENVRALLEILYPMMEEELDACKERLER